MVDRTLTAIASKRLDAEDGRRNDARAADAALLQQPGAAVARYQIVGLPRERHRQQKGIVRVARLDAIRQKRYGKPLAWLQLSKTIIFEKPLCEGGPRPCCLVCPILKNRSRIEPPGQTSIENSLHAASSGERHSESTQG